MSPRQGTFLPLSASCLLLWLLCWLLPSCGSERVEFDPNWKTCLTQSDCPSSQRCQQGSCTNTTPQESGAQETKLPDRVTPEPTRDLNPAGCVEGQERQCYEGPSGTANVGRCREGKQECIDGQWGPCQRQRTPEAERCDNGEDDDCDGLIDEGCNCKPGEEQNCGNDEGACREGKQICQSDGTWGACQGAMGPTTEICGDNKDNDCDGQTDEGCSP